MDRWEYYNPNPVKGKRTGGLRCPGNMQGNRF